MNREAHKWLLYLCVLVSLTLSANASIEELLNSYNFDFNNGRINVTSHADYMRDLDSDGVNDTLFINFTTNVNVTQTYYVTIGIDYGSGILENSSTVSLSQSVATSLSLSTYGLNGNKWNYSLQLLDENMSMNYMDYDIESAYYPTYEEGNDVYSLSDSKVGESLRIAVLMNISENETRNVSVTLEYDGKFNTEQSEVNLQTPVTTAYIYFENESVKSTHWDGEYNIYAVAIGDKLLRTDTNTSVYDYEDFAQTSYISSATSSTLDYDSDNFLDILELNFSVNIKSTGIYNLSFSLYDQDGIFITGANREFTFGSTGLKNAQVLINGTRLYAAKLDGPYNIGQLMLFIDNVTYDFIRNAHTTEAYLWRDFERPPQPDLVLDMDVDYEDTTNISHVTLTVTNEGEVPAINVWVDLFDNTTYEAQNFTYRLNVSQYKHFYFDIPNTIYDTLITAVTDFDNRVDESNESNNIVSQVADPFGPPGQFYIRNDTGGVVAWFSFAGDIYLKGTCTVGSPCTAPADSYTFEDSSSDVVAYIDYAGNLCIETGDCSDESVSCDPANDAVVWQNEGEQNVIYIDDTGDLCLTGTLYENQII